MLRTFEEELFNLRSASCLGSFETLTDANLGGQTTAALAFQEGGDEEGSLVFQGNFSSAIPYDTNPKVRRLGQASFGSKVCHGTQTRVSGLSSMMHPVSVRNDALGQYDPRAALFLSRKSWGITYGWEITNGKLQAQSIVV